MAAPVAPSAPHLRVCDLLVSLLNLVSGLRACLIGVIESSAQLPPHTIAS